MDAEAKAAIHAKKNVVSEVRFASPGDIKSNANPMTIIAGIKPKKTDHQRRFRVRRLRH
jgi:hypothetical protein